MSTLELVEEVEAPQAEVKIVHIGCEHHEVVPLSCGMDTTKEERYPEGLPLQDCVVCVALLPAFIKEHYKCEVISVRM